MMGLYLIDFFFFGVRKLEGCIGFEMVFVYKKR